MYDQDLDKDERGVMHDSRDASKPKETYEDPEFTLPQSNRLESFAVSIEKKITPDSDSFNNGSFEIVKDRNLLVVITTEVERWTFENVNEEILLCEIANKIKIAQPNLKISPLELLIIGRELGAKTKELKPKS